MTPVEPGSGSDTTREDLISRKGGLHRGTFTADGPHYRFAPLADRVPGP
ncbi:hypothetical protein ABZX38_25690 [Streptomyces longwoodensis]